MILRRVAQPSAFGVDRPVRNLRFFRLANVVLTTVSRWLYVINVGLAVSAAMLLVYTGVFVEHEVNYVSDGTVFSCRVDALKPAEEKIRK